MCFFCSSHPLLSSLKGGDCRGNLTFHCFWKWSCHLCVFKLWCVSGFFSELALGGIVHIGKCRSMTSCLMEEAQGWPRVAHYMCWDYNRETGCSFCLRLLSGLHSSSWWMGSDSYRRGTHHTPSLARQSPLNKLCHFQHWTDFVYSHYLKCLSHFKNRFK